MCVKGFALITSSIQRMAVGSDGKWWKLWPTDVAENNSPRRILAESSDLKRQASGTAASWEMDTEDPGRMILEWRPSSRHPARISVEESSRSFQRQLLAMSDSSNQIQTTDRSTSTMGNKIIINCCRRKQKLDNNSSGSSSSNNKNNNDKKNNSRNDYRRVLRGDSSNIPYVFIFLIDRS